MLPPTPKQIQDARDLGFHYTSTDPDDGSHLYLGQGGFKLRLTHLQTTRATIVSQIILQAQMAERLKLMDQLSGAARAFNQALHT